MNVSPREVEWLTSGDTGLSSKTIFFVLSPAGELARDGKWRIGDHPWDPADFGRCYRLLERFPEWRFQLHKVADAFPAWAPLVEAWTELEDLWRAESPERGGTKLYARMQELLFP